MKYLDDYDNCSTVLVGKNASKTGLVLMGHEEDDNTTIAQIHKVPHLHHEAGETLTFADGTAVVPQVPETAAYLWSELLRYPDGVPFGDSYLNEWGVAVGSNSCVSTKASKLPHKTGLGYGMRRILAERSHTAREGVELAAQLMRDYGYRSTRAYNIVDKNEAWVVQLTEGSQFVARRLGDDEIYFIPNWLTIHEVDFTDTNHEKFYWSEDVVTYAMENGWYTPKVPGDYSDFDFAAAYQGDDSAVPSNQERSIIGWRQITGDDSIPERTFSIPAPRKFGVEDLKALLRTHYLNREEDLKKDPRMSPHRYGLCRENTAESYVVEFAEEPDLTVLWRAFPRPCVSPYVPWFCGMTRTARGYAWKGVQASQASHFFPDEEEFHCHRDRAFWSFYGLMNTMEFDYQYGEKLVHSSIADLEQQWTLTVPEIRAAYRSLVQDHPETARALLTDWTHAQAQKAWDWAEDMTMRLVERKNFDNIAFWKA